MKPLLFYLCLIANIFSVWGQTFPMPMYNHRFVLMRDEFPNFITAPIYCQIERSHANTFVVSVCNGGYGLLDSMGKIILDPKLYSSVQYVQDSLSKEDYHFFSNNKEMVMIGKNGKIACKLPQFRVKEKWGDLLVINIYTYDSLYKTFSKEGDVADKAGVISLNGKWIIEPREAVFEFTSRHCFVMTDFSKNAKKKMSVLDHNGKLIIEDTITIVRNRELGDSLFHARHTAVFNETMAWLIDSTGKVVEKKVRKLRIKVFGNYNYGLKHHKGIVVEAKYNSIDEFDHGFIAYNSKSGTCDIYDLNGKLLAIKDYVKVYGSSHKANEEHRPEYLFGKKKNGSIYLLNNDFDPASTIAIDHIDTNPLYNYKNTILFTCKQKGNYGVMDQNGKLLIPFIYKYAPSLNANVISVQTGSDINDFYTVQGKMIIKGAYKVVPVTCNPSLYIITTSKNVNIYTLDPLKPALSNKNASYDEWPKHKLIECIVNGYHSMYTSDLKLLNETPFVDVNSENCDTNTLFVWYQKTGKKQFVNTKLEKVSEEYHFLKNVYKAENENIFLIGNRLNADDRDSKLKYGLMNSKGKQLIAPEWDTVILSPNYIIVKNGNNYMFADKAFKIDRTLVADSIDDAWKNYGLLYRNNFKWRLYTNGLSTLGFDKVLNIIDGKMYLKDNNKHGIYNFSQRKWIIPAQFDSTVKEIKNYNYASYFYTTKIGNSTYFVDSITGIIRGSGYSSIDLLFEDYDGPNITIPLHVANNGATKKSERSNRVVGGKFSLVNTKGKKFNTVDADHIEPLLYENPSMGYTMTYGVLWNVGGTVKDYIKTPADSAEAVFFDNDREWIGKEYVAATYGGRIVGGKFGIISSSGKEILPPIYDDINFAVNYSGREGLSKRYSFSDSIRHQHEIMILPHPMFIKQNGLWGIADIAGKILLPVQYDSIKSAALYNNVFKVWSKNSYGYFDYQGKEIIPVGITAETGYFVNPTETSYLLMQKGGSATTYSIAGDTVEVESYDQEGNPILLKQTNSRSQTFFTGGTFGFYNLSQDKLVFEPVFDEIIFTESCHPKNGTSQMMRMAVSGKYEGERLYIMNDDEPFELKKDGKWGMGDKTGKIIIPCIYDSIGTNSHDAWKQVWQGGNYGYTDENGKLSIPTKYHGDMILHLNGGAEDETFLLLQKGGSTRTFTVLGDTVDVIDYDEYGYEFIIRKPEIHTKVEFNGGAYGLYDMKKKVMLLDALYEDITEESPNIEKKSFLGEYDLSLTYSINKTSPYKIKQNGKWGVFFFDKGVVLKPEFDEIVFQNEEIIAKTAGVEKRFTQDGKPK